MKTTIAISEPIYRQARIRAVEQGITLKALVLETLDRALQTAPSAEPDAKVTYFAHRKSLPGFKAADEAGAYTPKLGDWDVTDLISEDRDPQ